MKDIEDPSRPRLAEAEEIVVEQDLPTGQAGSEIEVLAKKAAENLDGWQRCQADFDNYKKRSSESQKDLIKYATQNVVLQILPVIDNFHSSTDHIPEDQKENPWVTGIMYIQKQLENVLSENGVEEIAVKVGDNFDPIYHEAIEDKECASCKVDHKYHNKIKQVLTKGYKIGPARNASHSDAGGEKVIRAARVVVE